MKTKLALISTLAVLVILSSVSVASADKSISMVGSQWAVFEQTTLPNGNLLFSPAAHADTIPSGGVQFSMPDATASSPAYVNYLLDTFNVALTETNTISATINVMTSSPTTDFCRQS